MIAAELSVVGGKHTGQVIPLNRRKFLIGREQDCQLRPNSDMVSRHHCIFSIDDFAVRLRDLGSTNGTFVNGKRIQKETILASGDHVVIGNLEFRFSIAAGKSVDPSSSSEFDLRAKPEDTQVSSQTLMEMPTALPGAVEVPAAMESLVSAQPPSPPAVDTVVIPPGQMMPPQYGYPPQMMQPMGFPGGMYGGYPYQHVMPGYGQMYPQMMGQPMAGYPMPGMPDMSAPQAAAPTAAAAQAAIALPDPSSTGARQEAPKGSSGTKDPEKPTGAADAILKQYNGRRPSP